MGQVLPDELIPRCPVIAVRKRFRGCAVTVISCKGRKYDEQYQKISKYIHEEQREKDTLHGTWSGENDTDVYTGTFLESDAKPSGCLLYCRKRTI